MLAPPVSIELAKEGYRLKSDERSGTLMAQSLILKLASKGATRNTVNAAPGRSEFGNAQVWYSLNRELFPCCHSFIFVTPVK
jgi:hypothetical protein